MTDQPVVIREVFPTDVTLGDQYFRTAMVVVTRQDVRVFQLKDGDITQVFQDTYDPLASTLVDQWRLRVEPMIVATPQGVLRAQQAGGCGCSNPLKRWKPLPDSPRSRS